MARDAAYRLAEEKIEEAQRSGAKELDLSDMQLTKLPESLGQLAQMKMLDLSFNRLQELPDMLSQLTQLSSLNISCNRLTALPKWLFFLKKLKQLTAYENQIAFIPDSISNLVNLEWLHLSENQIKELPESFGHLSSLETLLQLGGNRLGRIPESVRQLTKLKELQIYDNGLEAIPEWLCELKQLKKLRINSNRLANLPTTLASIERLADLDLEGNPLNPELASAYEDGIHGVKRYLRELEKGGKNRYEAKLLILGDGNEGKTCVSRALRGEPFAEQSTTHGVDVEQWKFPHPDDAVDKEKEIILNVWDFEGQEISHQTHQFFLTSQALYLLVFKCRDQFLMDRAEYWLDTIRARAPKAKVVIVISQCEERSPHIPLDKIVAQYSDMLANEWFFSVGCKSGKNIDKLQIFLQRSAADLEFMGSSWPNSYEKAEIEIKKKADADTAHLTRAALNDILLTSGVSEDNYDGAAEAIARIGAITQFPDSPDLSDFVVLKPQWLTKAISKVMENGQLSEDKGEIGMWQMEALWNQEDHRGMFATFHNCMKEFELCYDLEDHSHCCLVPLRFGYVQPKIPWTNTPGLKKRRMEYKLNIRPPMGIMSRFIVKTHHMIVTPPDHPKGIYWHNGVFLRTSSPVPSEALCEFVPDERLFRVEVRAAFPQNMCEQIHGYIQALFSFFTGLSAERSYGCIKVVEETGAEAQCSGLHTEKRIYTAISKQREVIDCEFEEHEVDPRRLVWNMSSFGDFVAEKLTAADVRAIMREEMDIPPPWAEPFLRTWPGLLGWIAENSIKLDQMLKNQAVLSAEFKQEAELKLHEYLHCMSGLLDDREYTAAPGVISIRTKDRSAWNPVGYFKKTYVLTPFCECEGNIHACEDGSVEFTKDREWWMRTAPWIARGTRLLGAGLQLAFAGMPLALGKETADLIESEVKLMDGLTKHLEVEVPEEAKADGSERLTDGGGMRDLRGHDSEAALARASLAMFLEETAPANYRAGRWGSLKRVRMSDHTYRWLCEGCLKKSR